MKKASLLLVICIANCCQGQAQTPSFAETKKARHIIQYASFTLHAPVFAFAKSHLAGAGLDYGLVFYKNYRQKFAFTINGGIDYYLGEKKEIAEHEFTYGGYLNTYIHPGLFWYIHEKGLLSLSAGPEMGLYKGASDFGIGSRFFAGFYLGTHFLAGPGITYKKQSSADALWTVAGKLSYFF